MSTAPSGWQNPKTNWQATHVVGPADLNRIEGNINAIENGLRTIDSAQAPTGNQGTLRQLLDWFANRIKAVLGTTNWTDPPPTTLQEVREHIDATDSAHPAAAISYGGSSGLQAKNVEDALDELDAEKAGKDQVNTFTQRQTFAAGITDGDSNTDVSIIKSFQLPLDTRSLVATTWDAEGRPTTLQVTNGATVIATATITYNSNGKPTQMVITQGTNTVTITQTYENETKFLSRTKEVS